MLSYFIVFHLYCRNDSGEFKWTDGTIDTYTQWAAEGINGGEGCEEMKTNGNWNNTMCYSSNKRTSMCKKYTDGMYQNVCYINLAETKLCIFALSCFKQLMRIKR